MSNNDVGLQVNNDIFFGGGKMSLRRWFSMVVVLVAVLGISFSGFSIGEPDLVVTAISISPQQPSPGERVAITATVENTGMSKAFPSFYVSFEINGSNIERKRVSGGLLGGEKTDLTAYWTAVSGSSEISVIADDPFDKVSEANENNNELRRRISVSHQVAGSSVSGVNLAVARFDDRSGSGLANVGDGVADLLVQKLVQQGFSVVERQELESILMERQLNPGNFSALAQASRLTGADALIVGSVTGININKTTLNLGFLSVTGADVTVDISFRVINAYTGQILHVDSVRAQESGQTDFSLEIGTLLDTLGSARSSVCTGGFKTDKSVYYQGEIINFGYKKLGTSGWFNVRVNGNWVGSVWYSKQSNECLTITWNPTPYLSPGTYSATLHQFGISSPVSAVSFQVKSGSGPPTWVSEITVGTSQFADTVVGKAVEKALNRMSSVLVRQMRSSADQLISQREQFSSSQETEQDQQPAETDELKCRIFQVSEDGNTAFLGGIAGQNSCGTNSGVEVDDIFQIFRGTAITDPTTGEVVEYVKEDQTPKGKVIVLSSFDKVARVQRIGDFNLTPGDLAVRK